MRGRPAISRTFLRGTRLEPARAGITASAGLSDTVTSRPPELSRGSPPFCRSGFAPVGVRPPGKPPLCWPRQDPWKVLVLTFLGNLQVRTPRLRGAARSEPECYTKSLQSDRKL